MNHKLHKLLLLFTLLTVALLTSCQSSRSKGVVTGQYYYPDQAEENTKDTKEIQGTESVSDANASDTTEEASDLSEEPAITTDLFMIISNDMQSEKLILKQLASGKQYMYNYKITTRFLDKYGNRATASDFEPGRCITVDEKDIQGKLLEASLSDAVWEYPDVTRYSVDEDRGIFQIADTKYSYEENLFVNSDGEALRLSDLTDLDTLRIVGIGKKILSVSVTTGHGELQLENTDLFEDSYIQIGDRIFSQITKDMLLEIPEGTYTVTVANNGYGGSTDVTIEKGKKEVLDLDTLKGEGPKFGNILFAVNVADAIVQIDGKAVDYSKAVPVQYGVHTLQITADSYEPYSKKLVVNTEEATIVIGLTAEDSSTVTADSGDSDDSGTAEDEAAEKTENKSSATASGGKAGSLAGSHAGSIAGQSASSGTGSNTGTGSSTSTGSTSGVTDQSVTDKALNTILDSITSDDDDSADYLSTLSEVLSALTGN